jgi:hypothetical protein
MESVTFCPIVAKEYLGHHSASEAITLNLNPMVSYRQAQSRALSSVLLSRQSFLLRLPIERNNLAGFFWLCETQDMICHFLHEWTDFFHVFHDITRGDIVSLDGMI